MGRGESAESAFGRLVKRERERMGLSQAQLADVLAAELGGKVYPTTIAKIEARDSDRPRTIRLDEAAALARIFGRSLDEMLNTKPSVPVEQAVHLLVGALRLMSRNLSLEISDLQSTAQQLIDIERPTDTDLSAWSEGHLQQIAMIFALPAVYKTAGDLQAAMTKVMDIAVMDRESLADSLARYLSNDDAESSS